MEVLKQNGLQINSESEPKGEELLQTLVNLTGLPEEFAQKELHEILDSSGESPESRADITLEELRAALIRYLETMDPELEENSELNVDGKIPLPT